MCPLATSFSRACSAQQELLARLAACVEGALELGAAEGAVVQQAAVFTVEGNALGHALVNDVGGNFRQAVDVGFTGAEVVALHGVIEQAVDGVAVVLVVLAALMPPWAAMEWARRGCPGSRST